MFKFLLFLALILLSSCDDKLALQSGDLLFQESYSSALAGAIDEVTKLNNDTHFSHIGILEEKKDGSFQVLHAAPNGGTCVVSLSDFISGGKEAKRTIVYRLKPKYQVAIPKALIAAHNMLGKAYNYSYIMNDSSHYCSEYVYNSFKEDSIFTLDSMTFKSPTTGDFSKVWVEHYQSLGIEIPEGMLGCNPNGLASSAKLDRLGEISQLTQQIEP